MTEYIISVDGLDYETVRAKSAREALEKWTEGMDAGYLVEARREDDERDVASVRTRGGEACRTS